MVDRTLRVKCVTSGNAWRFKINKCKLVRPSGLGSAKVKFPSSPEDVVKALSNPRVRIEVADMASTAYKTRYVGKALPLKAVICFPTRPKKLKGWKDFTKTVEKNCSSLVAFDKLDERIYVQSSAPALSEISPRSVVHQSK